MLETEMALSDAKVRCSDLERQLEDARANLEMSWLKISQDGELEQQEKKKFTSKLLEVEQELARKNKQLEDVRAAKKTQEEELRTTNEIVEEQVSVVCFFQSNYSCQCEHCVANANIVCVLYVKGTENA